jgi:hypothetical protein
MRLLPGLLALLLLAAAPRPMVCAQPADHHCGIGDLGDLSLGDGVATARRIIRVDPAQLPLERPLTVRVAALASSEVLWNGRLIGRNGVPGDDRAAEIPGRYFASFVVPPTLIRPGDNLVTVRLSAEHLWLPVRRPVHILDVGPYETSELPGRTGYLPALLALGAIAAAFAWFAAAAAGRAGGGAALVAAFALVAMLQLGAEVSRAFLAYAYPWALARVAAIAILSSCAAVLIALYAARRFAPLWARPIGLVAAAAALASLVLVPWFDLKAMGAILAGALALGFAALIGIRRREPGARWAAGASAAIVLAMFWELTDFLNRGWHLLVATMLILLVVEQIGQLRAARAGAARGAALEERLRRAEEAGEPIVELRNGSRVHRVAEADILYARAADDYCEAVLKDGRTLLVTTTLGRLLERLPDRFVRVHKSYAVNRVHVASRAPRPGGGRMLNLSDGSSVPVGRSYGAAIGSIIG